MKRVAIIGAGPAGICAARQFLVESPGFTVKVFEKHQRVGGTWVYDEDIEVDDLDQMPSIDTLCAMAKTSLYKNLQTNLPKEVMAYPDFNFPQPNKNSFLKHNDVLSYIEAYCQHFNLYDYIHFGKEIIMVEPCDEAPQPGFIQWLVTSKDVNSGEELVESFDSVIVCNGHYDVPSIPQIKNVSSFKGIVTHSRFYRKPEPFRNKTVAVLGARASGQDIAIDIASVAKRVLLCHKGDRLKSKLLPNIEEKLNIVGIAIESGALLFEDGSSCLADVLIYCTGYLYSLPFLSKRCKVKIEHGQKVVTPLYKHLFHTTFPSMVFIGLPYLANPLPLFYFQSVYAVAVLGGTLKLPSRLEMDIDIQKEAEERAQSGLRKDQFHLFGSLQWPYKKQLAALTGVDCPGFRQNLYMYVCELRQNSLLNYRKTNVKVIDDENFEVLAPFESNPKTGAVEKTSKSG